VKLGSGNRGKKLPEEQLVRRRKPCTIDGIQIYPSKQALVAALGNGKMGFKHPNFTYLEA
jgi:hypothetical protein